MRKVFLKALLIICFVSSIAVVSFKSSNASISVPSVTSEKEYEIVKVWIGDVLYIFIYIDGVLAEVYPELWGGSHGGG